MKLLEDLWDVMTDPGDSIPDIAFCVVLWIIVLDVAFNVLGFLTGW